MATQTTHYNLTKPDPTDLVDVSVLNGNADIIDQKIFEASQSGGSSAMIETSVEASATSAHAYAAGDHFIYNGTLYRATAAIAIGDTITPGTNCTAVTVASELEGKVDKVTGKQLSTEDYTTAEKTKLSGIEAQANKTVIDDTLTNTGEAADAKAVGDEIGDVKAMIEPSAETSATSAHAYAAGDHFIYNGTLYRATAAIAIGDTITPESNCVATTVMTEVEAGGGGGGGTSDYTQLSNKPQINGNTLTGNKTGADLGLVNAVTGKQLSTEDYTTAEKTKLSGIEAQANKTVIDDTLTNTGEAADAKAVGDEISDVRNTLNHLEDGLAIIVNGDTCTTAVPVGGYAYITNNTHGLAEGLYTNTSASAFPTSGGTANSSVFTIASGGGLNSLKDSLLTVDSYSSGNVNAIKIGKTVFLTWGSATIDSDGKTFTVVLPERFRPSNEVTIASKCYNGSSYTDCRVLVTTNGIISLTNFLNQKIDGIQPAFYQTRPVVYCSN